MAVEFARSADADRWLGKTCRTAAQGWGAMLQGPAPWANTQSGYRRPGFGSH